MNNKIVITGIVILLVFAGGLVLLISSKSNKRSLSTASQTPTSLQTIATKIPESTFVKESTVTLTDSGFKPQTITVKTGTKIIWINKSGGEATVNSDDHPTHKLYPEINLGNFADGTTHQLILTKPGTYTYHDHFHPERKGTVIVE